ncbi:MAG: hypothetical protein E7012_06425 [Alphaproteobacteria bacterium]|nr:hypothetical protein [Alphaproteobacteria bacterium]
MQDILRTVFKYREKKSPDKLGLYPEQVHVKAMPERRYLWTSRFLVICACLSICLSMMLAMTIFLLLPQRGAFPRLLQTNHYYSQLELTDRLEKAVAVRDLIAEQSIHEYIVLRHAISRDYDEMQRRWAPGRKFYWLSSQSVYNNFVHNDMPTNLNLFRNQSLIRLVEVEWLKPIARGLWHVQFITMDYKPSVGKPQINIWRAYIRGIFTEINYANIYQRAYNPFGFLILNYSLSYVGTPDEPESYMSKAKEARIGRIR